MSRLLFIILFFFFCNIVINAQVRTTEAVKALTPPRIDGVPDDDIWQNVPIATGFITNTPVFGNPGSRSEVKVTYDNTAIYVAAMLFEHPDSIRRQFTPRDQLQSADVDYFSIFIDTYKDRQNAFQFMVTTRNVQSDARVSPTSETGFGIYGDLSWDAVWESKVAFHPEGWSVEMRIPFFSIRFSRRDIQDWGIQFLRFSRKNNETSFWNPVDPKINGFVNQFGDLTGLQSLVPPLRLSFSPYVSGGFRGIPYNGGYDNEWLKSGGMDVKYGISESFTLDATLIPDFGQVISDNIVNNITPFEIQFRENRPFFTEGTELFNKAEIFYSRRIGKTPDRYEEVMEEVRGGSLQQYEILRNPDVTRLYNAIKFSGRTRNNLGIGIFNAVAQPVKAKLRNRISGMDSTILTETLTNYNVFVLDQALKNRSYVTFTNTNVLRDGTERDANVTALDIAFYDKQNRFGIAIKPRYSRIFNSNGGYGGFKNSIEAGKVSGKWQYSVSNEFETDQYDPNDLGFLSSPNEMTTEAEVNFVKFDPTKLFLNQRYGFAIEQSYLYKPFEYQKTEITAFAFWIFKNFWDLQIEAGTSPVWQNDFFELRTPADVLATPRMKLRRSPFYFLFFEGSSDSRKPLFVRWNFGGAEGPLPSDPYYRLGLGARYRFSDRFSIDADWLRQYDNGQFGYAFVRDPVTNAPILARRKYTEVTTVISGIYNFTARMNITFRARHFWNRLLNTNLYDVLPDGNWAERFDFTPSDFNVNYNAFNFDLFYTWDFRLGSRIVFGYKNWLGRDFESSISGVTNKTYLSNTGQLFATPHGNEVTLRFIYFLDYMQLRKKR